MRPITGGQINEEMSVLDRAIRGGTLTEASPAADNVARKGALNPNAVDKLFKVEKLDGNKVAEKVHAGKLDVSDIMLALVGNDKGRSQSLKKIRKVIKEDRAIQGDTLEEANNPMADEVIKLIHDKRAAIKANDRKAEAKIHKQIRVAALKMMKPAGAKLNADVKAFFKSKEKELKNELAGLPVTVYVSAGKPYATSGPIEQSFEIKVQLNPVTK